MFIFSQTLPSASRLWFIGFFPGGKNIPLVVCELNFIFRSISRWKSQASNHSATGRHFTTLYLLFTTLNSSFGIKKNSSLPQCSTAAPIEDTSHCPSFAICIRHPLQQFPGKSLQPNTDSGFYSAPKSIAIFFSANIEQSSGGKRYKMNEKEKLRWFNRKENVLLFVFESVSIEWCSFMETLRIERYSGKWYWLQLHLAPYPLWVKNETLTVSPFHFDNVMVYLIVDLILRFHLSCLNAWMENCFPPARM